MIIIVREIFINLNKNYFFGMKKNIIIASSKWTYTINPNIFFFGTDFDGASVIKATITYTIGNGQSTLSSSVTKRRNKKSKL